MGAVNLENVMPDNLKITHPQDAKRINMNEPYEVKFWCAKFGVTEAQLKAAIAACGSDYAAKVAKQLGKSYP